MRKNLSLLAVAIAAATSSSLIRAEEPSTIKLSGELAVDVEYAKGYDDAKVSDVYVDTFLLNLDHDVNKHVALHAALLHEENPLEDNSDIGLDEAFITIKPPTVSNLSLVLGRQYVPFGLHTSNMVTDPLTLLISEVNDSAFTVSYSDGFTAHAFIMNGNTKKAQTDDEATKDHAREFGLGAGYEAESFSLGLDWINSLAEAGDIVDAVGSDNLVFESYLPGVSLWAQASLGEIELLAEYVAATKEFEASEFSFNSEGAKPSAISVEAKYGLGFNEAWLGLRLDQTSELLFLGAPKSSVSFGYGQQLFENTEMKLEVYRAKDYDDTDVASVFGAEEATAGTGESSNGLVFQVGVSF